MSDVLNLKFCIGNLILLSWMDSPDWNKLFLFCRFPKTICEVPSSFLEDDWISDFMSSNVIFFCCRIKSSEFFCLCAIRTCSFLALSLRSLASCSLLILNWLANLVLDRYCISKFRFFNGLWALYGFKPFFSSAADWLIICVFF